MQHARNPIPELLAPAGDPDRLQAALSHGADAVYLGLPAFGMRQGPANFTPQQLADAVKAAHKQGVRVYLTCNIVPRGRDMQALPAYIDTAAACGVDAAIVSDLGVLQAFRARAPQIDIHISTQAGVMNAQTAMVLHEMGAKRIVLARELSLKEIHEIRRQLPSSCELECFVHGAMCVSFSGRCLLSNYLTGRDSNAGDCAQPCRWQYALVEETRPGTALPFLQDSHGSYLLNAKDLCMIAHLPQLIAAGINSLKIEGRAKSAYYTAVITNAYRCALDDYAACDNPQTFTPKAWVTAETKKISYRDYCTGFFFDDPLQTAHISEGGGYRRAWEVAAIVEHTQNRRITVSQRNRFFEGEALEVFLPRTEPFSLTVQDLQNAQGEPVDNAPNPMQLFSFASDTPLPPGAILRRKRRE